VRDEVYKEVTAEMQEANRNAVSPKGFELARAHRRLDEGPLHLGFVDVGGWDTHVNEGGATATSPAAGRARPRPLRIAEAIGPAWNEAVVWWSASSADVSRERRPAAPTMHGSVYW